MPTSTKLKKTKTQCTICFKWLKNPLSKIHIQSKYHQRKIAAARGDNELKKFEQKEAYLRCKKLYKKVQNINGQLFWCDSNYKYLEKLLIKSFEDKRRTDILLEFNLNKNPSIQRIDKNTANVVEIDIEDGEDLFGSDMSEDECWDKKEQEIKIEENEINENRNEIILENNMAHHNHISFDNQDQLLEDYREMMLQRKLRKNYIKEKEYKPPTWIPKHIYLKDMPKMSFFREDRLFSNKKIIQTKIIKKEKKDVFPLQISFNCKYCDLDFNDNKEYYKHCNLLSHRYRTTLHFQWEDELKIQKLVREYKPEELGKNGKPKKAYRESKKRFKQRMIDEMLEDYNKGIENKLSSEIGDGTHFKNKCLNIKPEVDYKIEDIGIISPSASPEPVQDRVLSEIEWSESDEELNDVYGLEELDLYVQYINKFG